MKRQRLAVVAYPVGRVGSSAMMGLLHLAGFHVGSDRSLFTPAAMNPKGFFELPEQERFLRETWSGIYPHVSIPPAARMVDRIAPEAAPAYGRVLDDALGGASPAAVKSQWCLTLPLLRELGDEMDVRVVYMERIREDQIDSLLRVWRASGDPARRHASRDFVAEFIDRWRAFGEETLKRCAFPVRRVSFDALVADPVPVVNDVAAFLEVDPPEEETVRGWLDPSLVNRKVLALGGRDARADRPSPERAGGARLSVVVNTRNAADVLDGCLRSAAAVADEIVVVDMESGDGTEEIARRYTERFFTVPPAGYVEPARQTAIEKATGDWVFVLDADERLSCALAAGIRDVIAKDDDTALFLVPRRNLFAGRWMTGSGVGPDREMQPRLFRRGRVRWPERIHSRPDVDGPVRALPLPESAYLRHRWAETISDFTARLDRYTGFEASALAAAGERWSMGAMVGAMRAEIDDRYEPAKDGARSLVIAVSLAYYRFLAWMKLWEKEGRRDVELPPTPATLFERFVSPNAASNGDGDAAADRHAEEAARLAAAGDIAAAIGAMTRAIEAAPDRPRYYSGRANLRYAAGDADESVRDLRKAIEVAPDYLPAYVDLATVHLGLSRTGEAERALVEAAALAPDDPDVLATWAGLCRSTGRPGEAADFYEKSAAGGAAGVEPLLAAGLCYFEAGRPGDAKRVYERALAVDPECEIAAENLRVLAGAEP